MVPITEFWKQAGGWINSSIVYLNNTSENKLLGYFQADKAELRNNLTYHEENLWKIGNDGFFNLTHRGSGKLLTATSSPSNTLKVDKSM